jgi:hypothetical protein
MILSVPIVWPLARRIRVPVKVVHEVGSHPSQSELIYIRRKTGP